MATASTDALEAARFSEFHHRDIERPIEAVWSAALAVSVREVRSLAPLMALRSLPRLLARERIGEGFDPDAPLLDAFSGAGFVVLRRDSAPSGGRALLRIGAIGRFWSPTSNGPLRLADERAFREFNEPGYAITDLRLEAIDLGGGHTRLETETRIAGTDAGAERKFAPYWALIRLPSGWIRRSWLAAVDRRARAPASP